MRWIREGVFDYRLPHCRAIRDVFRKSYPVDLGIDRGKSPWNINHLKTRPKMLNSNRIWTRAGRVGLALGALDSWWRCRLLLLIFSGHWTFGINVLKALIENKFHWTILNSTYFPKLFQAKMIKSDRFFSRDSAFNTWWHCRILVLTSSGNPKCLSKILDHEHQPQEKSIHFIHLKLNFQVVPDQNGQFESNYDSRWRVELVTTWSNIASYIRRRFVIHFK